ncbi:MAG: MerR family transcriptional regulator [Evtepia gabavorous]
MEKHRFKTAEFAALCGVKKDTLLHYDHIGLLKPQWVGENGYRYYSARQIPTYDLIATLRRLGTPLAEIRSYLTRRSPEALMDLLREKEADWEAERRRLARMGAFLHNAKDKMALAQTVRPGEIRLETFPEAHCAVVEAPDFAHAKFEEAVYLLHVRQLITWARENGSPSQAPGTSSAGKAWREGILWRTTITVWSPGNHWLAPPGPPSWDVCGSLPPGLLCLRIWRLPPASGLGAGAGVCHRRRPV